MLPGATELGTAETPHPELESGGHPWRAARGARGTGTPAPRDLAPGPGTTFFRGLARSGTLAVDMAAVIGTQRRVLGRTSVFFQTSPTYDWTLPAARSVWVTRDRDTVSVLHMDFGA